MTKAANKSLKKSPNSELFKRPSRRSVIEAGVFDAFVETFYDMVEESLVDKSRKSPAREQVMAKLNDLYERAKKTDLQDLLVQRLVAGRRAREMRSTPKEQGK